MIQRLSVTEVCSEFEQRLHHSDRSVRSIAKTLLHRLRQDAKSWLHHVIEESSRHTSLNPFEVALLLEKIVLHHELSSFWDALPNIDAALPRVRGRIGSLIRSGWSQTVAEITEEEAVNLVGSPIQTHRVNRYEGLFNLVVAPFFRDRTHPLVILDAGAAAGVGAYAARALSFPVKRWLAVDRENPRVRLPWILTCSVRVGEIFSSDVLQIIQRFRQQLSFVNFVQADFTDMRQTTRSSSADLYLALYSFYQISNVARAMSEARRVTRDGGLIIVTDHVRFDEVKNVPKFVSPGQNGELLTLGWINGKGFSEPFPLYRWEDTDLTRGKPIQLDQAVAAYQEVSVR